MRALRWLFRVGTLLLGAAVALTSVAVHRADVLFLPVGVALAVATSLLLAWELRQVPEDRWLVAWYAAGWLWVTVVAVRGRPEGDVAIGGDLAGYALLAVGGVLPVVTIVSLVSHDSGSGRTVA